MTDDEIDEEWCELHNQDGNECESLDPLKGPPNEEFAQCRRFRWNMYIRGEIAPTIVEAAKRHFNAPNN